MTCFRANKFAQRDREELEAAKKEIGQLGGDAGKRIGAALRVMKTAIQHETEKLKSLQDVALKSQKKKESFREKVTNKEISASKKRLDYYKAKTEAMESVRSIHEETKKEEAIQRQIDEKTDRLAGIQKERGARADVAGEKRTQLKAKLEDLNNQIKKKGKIESLMKQKAEVERLIKEGPKEKEAKPAKPVSPEEAALIKEISDLKAQVKDTPWKQEALKQASIKNYAARLDRSAAEYERKLAENDFTSKRTYREQIKTPEILAKEKNLDRLKNEARKAVERIEFENKTNVQKALDFVTNVKRFSILSSPKSLGKLLFASAEVAITRGFTEGAGYALRAVPIVSRIADVAPMEGGRASDIGTDVANYYRGLLKGLTKEEFKNIFSGKGSYLDIKFGKDSGIPDGMILGFFGRLHEYIKNPTRLANYEMAYQRYLNWAERQPDMNIDDESVMQQAEIEAFKYANRSIFKEDRQLVQFYQNAISRLEKSQGLGGKGVAFLAKQTLPIVRIPTNIIAQTFEYAFGSIPAGLKILNLAFKGLDTLKPEEADVIMRQLKNGSAGLTMMAIGALFEEQFGGVYISGEEKGEQEYGSIAGIPKVLLENPLFACLQLGATASRYWKRHFDEASPWYGEDNAITLGKGAALASLGVVAEAPFIKSVEDFEKIYKSRERLPETVAEIYARPFIPAASQYVADMMDLQQPIDWSSWQDVISNFMSPKHNVRSPENLLDVFRQSMPGLRNDVPLR
jgi:hypothetical protein